MHGPPSGCSTRDCYRDGEKERERRRGERCSVCLRKREKEKGGVSRERAIVVHKHTCRHRKKPKDGEEKRIGCTAQTQPGIQIQGAAHANHRIWNTSAPHCRTWPVRLDAVYSSSDKWKCLRKREIWNGVSAFYKWAIFSQCGNHTQEIWKVLLVPDATHPPCDQDSSSWFPILMNNLVPHKIWRQMPAAVFLSYFLNDLIPHSFVQVFILKYVLIHTE